MSKPTWELFLTILSAVVVFVVPMVLYLMEKAGINIVRIFIVGWISIGAACLYLVLNIPWVWAETSIGVRVWRASFVSAAGLLAVGYYSIKIWPPSVEPTTISEVQKNEPSAGAAPVEPDIHQLLNSGKLVQGWTLHKRDNSWSLYSFSNTEGLSEPMVRAMAASDVGLKGDMAEKAHALWSDINARTGNPKPVETEYGIVKGQTFVEHIVHYLDNPNKIKWTYEVFQNGNGITPTPQPFRELVVTDLSTKNQSIVSELDAIAIRTVNRRYVDALKAVSE